MPIEEIRLKSSPQLGTILDEYCEQVGLVPTVAGKAFFREWDGEVPAKLLRQCIFAGIFWAKQHPDDVVVVEERGE